MSLQPVFIFRLCKSVLTLQGGGFWQPDAAALAKLRRDIDRKPHRIKAVLRNPSTREAFLGGVDDDDKKAVKAFTSLSMNQSNALKRNPKVSSVCPIIFSQGFPIRFSERGIQVRVISHMLSSSSRPVGR